MTDSAALRMKKEQEKARLKYGEVALAPGGNPAYDIFDYAINEIIGMNRYGEMCIHRGVVNPEWGPEIQGELYEIGADMQRFAFAAGERLIRVREALLARGIDLGKPETR